MPTSFLSNSRLTSSSKSLISGNELLCPGIGGNCDRECDAELVSFSVVSVSCDELPDDADSAGEVADAALENKGGGLRLLFRFCVDLEPETLERETDEVTEREVTVKERGPG